MEAEKIVIEVKGVVASSETLGMLFETLSANYLGNHLSKPTEVVIARDGYNFAIYVKKSGEDMLRSALSETAFLRCRSSLRVTENKVW